MKSFIARSVLRPFWHHADATERRLRSPRLAMTMRRPITKRAANAAVSTKKVIVRFSRWLWTAEPIVTALVSSVIEPGRSGRRRERKPSCNQQRPVIGLAALAA